MKLDLDRLVNRLADATHEAKSKWLEQQMDRLLPADIIVSAKSERGKERMKAVRYMQVNKIVLQEYPPEPIRDESYYGEPPKVATKYQSKTRLMHGNRVVSEFHIRLNGIKVEVMVKEGPLTTGPRDHGTTDH